MVLEKTAVDVRILKPVKRALKKVIKFSDKNTEKNMHGVNFKTINDELLVATTDGFRLVIYTIDIKQIPNLEMNFTISINDARRLLKATKIMESFQTESELVVITSDSEIRLAKIEKPYPNYLKVTEQITDDLHFSFMVDRKKLLDTIIKFKDTNLIEVSLKDNALYIESEKVYITATTVKDFNIEIRPSFLIEGLKLFDDELIYFSYKKTSKYSNHYLIVMNNSDMFTDYEWIHYFTASK
jgi:DNA polymerase III sliding clamp (beta) subunit (PCNA family)